MLTGRSHAAVLVVTLAVALSLLLAACAKTEPASIPSPTATVAATPTPTASPTPEDPVAAGHALYLAKGCAACHGQDAEGTALAPALPGRTVEQVQRQVRNPVGVMPAFQVRNPVGVVMPAFQVRNPVGVMPAFSEAQMSDAELDQIAAFIASLEAE